MTESTFTKQPSRSDRPNWKQTLSQFLAKNPFSRPLTLGFFYREKMRAIHMIAPDQPFQSILEVGGGQGGLTALLYPKSHITNLDFEPKFAQATCNQQPNVRFVCGDATQLPFPDHSFDAVTMFDVLEHIPDDHRAVAEAFRVLKPNGFLMVSTPDASTWRFPYYSFMKSICPPEEAVMAEWGHVRRGYTMTQLKALIPLPCQKYATFINPVTVLCHDIAFSKLPRSLSYLICCLLSPVTWAAYLLHKPNSSGAETASIWQKI